MSKTPSGSNRASGKTDPAVRLLLVGLQSPINVGMILRLAETFGVGVTLLGSDGLLTDAGKVQTISDFACGAFERTGYRRLPDAAALPAAIGHGRLIATTIEDGALALPEFRFRRGDIIALGNEYDGLSPEVAAAATVHLFIPMADVFTPKPPSSNPIDPTRRTPPARDGRPNLNVAVAAGILCYNAFLASRVG